MEYVRFRLYLNRDVSIQASNGGRAFRLLSSSRSTDSFCRLSIVLITLAGILLLSWVMFNPIRVMAKAPGPIPVAMHSAYAADYSADPASFVVQPISLDLIDEVIRNAGGSPDTSGSNLSANNLSAPTALAVVFGNTATAVPVQNTEKSKQTNTLPPTTTATPLPSLEPDSTLVVILPTATSNEILLPAATHTQTSIQPVQPAKTAPGLQRPTNMPKPEKTAQPEKKPHPTRPVKIKKTRPAGP